ncbi:MAG: lipopolysaccharide/colanic/teichoic acid biosynthesis glycosyltransferase [Saprospiraceae bacterium]|jgi:lipopolysaccharide/colanic/teichoic acid biosynthesis glycosyltransferase
MNKHQLSAIGLVLIDWSMALLAWIVFFGFRKNIEGMPANWQNISQDERLWQGLLLIPLCWILLFTILGTYRNTLAASRLSILQNTLIAIGIGAFVLLLGVLSDDLILDFKSYLYSFLSVFLIHFVSIAIGRMIYLSFLKWLVQRRVISWNICLIGGDYRSVVPAYINVANKILSDEAYGSNPSELKGIDEIWIAEFPQQELEQFLPLLVGKAGNKGVLIHEHLWRQLEYRYNATPKLKMPFVGIEVSPISWWQRHIKRIGDLGGSLLALLILSPMMLMIAYKVKKSSKGGIFYTQERIGRWGVPFEIIKFRTMIENAEPSGPSLARSVDPRCTPIGLWMRKWRLDEIPQFLNVIKGDMSLVGPRPERKYYTDQLIELNHLYPSLWQVRPGITSWGQIKYGYASNINQMLQRFRFDLLYIEKIDLLLDLRILYYTVIVLLQGKGR